MAKRAICRVIGAMRPDSSRPKPFLPIMVQVNIEDNDGIVVGDVVDIVLRVEVQQLVPAPLGDAG